MGVYLFFGLIYLMFFLSGSAALIYEVVWVRSLTLVFGGSHLAVTAVLSIFMAGLAIGGNAIGRYADRVRKPLRLYGLLELGVAASALIFMGLMKIYPSIYVAIAQVYNDSIFYLSSIRILFSVFALVIPTTLMGGTLPVLSRFVSCQTENLRSHLSFLYGFNTLGAVFGARLSGFLFLQIYSMSTTLYIANVSLGLFVLANLQRNTWLKAGVVSLALTTLGYLALDQTALRFWDMNYFAIFRSNQPEAFRTPEMVREAVENTDVLYYAEGIESIISVIKVKGGDQSFLTNGRIEASSHLQGQQHLLTLGHLPMLLNRNPKKVLVVGLGGGMTLGAISIHSSLQQVTLAEIEPKVIGVARAFEEYNHHVLNNSKLKIVFNDGRNFLLTTKEKFDVITADPIHPWFRGAGYLYTTQYFKLAADHLQPGGVICQWLPIYELTPQDLQSVVRTFQEHFRFTLMWLTHSDAEIVGSNSPILIDETELERRIAEPLIAGDLKKVIMGSAADFLSYFVMGTEGMKRFGRDGILNTDDNLYLEFSAPFSIAHPSAMEVDINAINAYRESIQPYLLPVKGEKALEEQRTR